MFQVLRYIVQIWSREFNAAKEEGLLADFTLPPVLPIIVHHGERNFSAPVRLGKLIRSVEGFGQHMPDFEGILLDLTRLSEDDLPEEGELYGVFGVMQAIFSKDKVDRMRRIYRKLSPKLHIPHYRDRWLKLCRYLVTSTKITREEFQEVTDQMSDTDVMILSPLCQEWWDGGREEGLEKAREKTVRTLLRILTRRFGDVPDTVRDRLYAIHDLDKLDELEDVAWDCMALEDFEAALMK